MPTPQPDGYLAMPPSGSGDPVLVLHPWWGLNATIKGVCDRLAAEGFAAFAPDLYHGRVATTIADAEALVNALDQQVEQAKADVAASAHFLRDHPGAKARTLAVIGFSLGAYYALDLSISAPELVRQVVVFYGTGPADFTLATAEYLCHFAGNDPYEPPESTASLEQALQDAGRPAVFYTYPGTGHWFFEPDRADAYHEAAASLAWARTLAFLRRTSGG